MEKQKLWDRVKDTVDKSKEKFQEYKDIAMDKAEVSADILKLRFQKMQLERKIYKNLAKLGAAVYGAGKKQKKKITTDIPKIENLLNDTKKLDRELVKIVSILDDLSKS